MKALISQMVVEKTQDKFEIRISKSETITQKAKSQIRNRRAFVGYPALSFVLVFGLRIFFVTTQVPWDFLCTSFRRKPESSNEQPDGSRFSPG
jgi:hypothetical protein